VNEVAAHLGVAADTLYRWIENKGFQDVLAQAKTGMKKRLIVLVRSVEILDQAQQSCAIKTRELCLNICPRW
jgi:transposase-like protein